MMYGFAIIWIVIFSSLAVPLDPVSLSDHSRSYSDSVVLLPLDVSDLPTSNSVASLAYRGIMTGRREGLRRGSAKDYARMHRGMGEEDLSKTELDQEGAVGGLTVPEAELAAENEIEHSEVVLDDASDNIEYDDTDLEQQIAKLKEQLKQQRLIANRNK